MAITRRAVLKGALVAGAGTLAGTGAYGYIYARHNLEVTRATVPIAALPSALAGLRVPADEILEAVWQRGGVNRLVKREGVLRVERRRRRLGDEHPTRRRQTQAEDEKEDRGGARKPLLHEATLAGLRSAAEGRLRRMATIPAPQRIALVQKVRV